MPDYFYEITTETTQDKIKQGAKEHKEKLNNYLKGRGPYPNAQYEKLAPQMKGTGEPIEREVESHNTIAVVTNLNTVTFVTFLCCDDEYENR